MLSIIIWAVFFSLLFTALDEGDYIFVAVHPYEYSLIFPGNAAYSTV